MVLWGPAVSFVRLLMQDILILFLKVTAKKLRRSNYDFQRIEHTNILLFPPPATSSTSSNEYHKTIFFGD